MSNSPQAYLLDSFALLSYLQNEQGAGQVQELLGESLTGRCRALVSLISLGEVLYIAEREQGLFRARAVLSAIEQLPVEALPVTRQVVLAAAHIKARFPISYADAFVAAAAQDLGATIVTGDPEFGHLGERVPILWLQAGSQRPTE